MIKKARNLFILNRLRAFLIISYTKYGKNGFVQYFFYLRRAIEIAPY